MSIVNDLRELADFLETRPMLRSRVEYEHICLTPVALTTEELQALSRELGGKRDKDISANIFAIERKLTNYITIRIISSRETVCTRKVVGTRDVPESRIPEQIIPARIEEIVEWECPESILAAESPAEAGV